MSDTTGPGEMDQISTREWVKGVFVVVAVVAITIVLPLVLLYTAAQCGCETRAG